MEGCCDDIRIRLLIYDWVDNKKDFMRWQVKGVTLYMTKIIVVRPEEREARLEGYFVIIVVRDAHFVSSSPRTDALLKIFSCIKKASLCWINYGAM